MDLSAFRFAREDWWLEMCCGERDGAVESPSRISSGESGQFNLILASQNAALLPLWIVDRLISAGLFLVV